MAAIVFVLEANGGMLTVRCGRVVIGTGSSGSQLCGAHFRRRSSVWSHSAPSRIRNEIV